MSPWITARGRFLRVTLWALAFTGYGGISAQGQEAANIGAELTWSIEGKWTSVANDPKKGTIFAADRSGRFAEFDADGKKLREANLSAPVGRMLRVARAANGDITLLHFSVWASPLTAFDFTAKPLWKYDSGIDDVWTHDLDADGNDEIIVGFNGGAGVHVLDIQGKLLWKSNAIANVWHVSAGDVLGDGKRHVVTTSAVGKVHIFGNDAKQIGLLDAGCYANLVRVGRISEKDKAATIIVSGRATVQGDRRAILLVRLDGDGTRKWSLELPSDPQSSVGSAYFADGTPWCAVGMRGGLVHVVNVAEGRLVATVKGQGISPEIVLAHGSKLPVPVLVVTTGDKLNAYRITLPKST